MKYWGYLIAKLVAAGGLVAGLWFCVERMLPPPQPFLTQEVDGFGQDLGWTLVVFALWLLSVGLLYWIIRDQKTRCRVCLRRLRMPVAMGSWSNSLLLSPPRTEWICPYGHGTLSIMDIQFSGEEDPDWHKNGDMWDELFHTQETGK